MNPRIFFLIPALALSALSAPSAPASLDISSQVDRSEITIGDRIRYEIKVVYPKDGRVELPSVLGNLGSFEVKDYQASDPKEAGQLLIQTWSFDLSTFTVGKYTIPPQQVAYRQGSDTTAAVWFTQPIEINVIRTSPETVKDIADIAPLAEVKTPPPWLAIGLGAAALLALALLLWRKLRRKRPVVAAKAVLPPFEEAMAQLAGIKDLALIRQNRAREFSFILSEAQRRYISRRYGIDAMESTTSEFVDKIRKLPVTAAQRQWLAKTAEDADLVKFANAPLLESDAAAMLSQTEEFLRQTKPREDDMPPPPRPEGGKLTGKPAPVSGGLKHAAKSVSQPPAKAPVKPKGPAGPIESKGSNGANGLKGPGPGYTQGGHGHDGDDGHGGNSGNGKGWVG